MKKRIIIGLSLFACVALNAQEPGGYLHLNAGGGIHDFNSEFTNGLQQDAKLGYTVNAAYSYFFGRHFGLQTGVGLQTISGLSTLSLSTAQPATDDLGRAYEFRTKYSNWKEQQSALFVDIPLLLQLRQSMGTNVGLLASFGGKVSLPVLSSYKSTGTGSYTTTGYYSQWKTEFSDLPKYGFATTNSVKGSDLSLKPAYMAVADLGGLIRLTDRTNLYIGGYVNYGLNSISKAGTKDLVQPGNVYSGLFSSNMIKSSTPLSFGVKVGLYIKTGKKDSDGDGVSDRKDKCPNTPAAAWFTVDKNGCPMDSDGDGVPDYLDKCPNTVPEAYGKVDTLGCPIDTDKDGVPDYLDKCADTPKEAIGFVDQNGCPLDTDGDGVPDYRDKCPNTPKEAISTVNADGCPKDSDGDGVFDYLDQCPNTSKEVKGLVNAHGCPLDTDGDGIFDYLDNCPNILGVAENHGCPQIKKEVRALFKKALLGIQFETGKHIIKPTSFNVLNQIAVMLLANPTYYIEIQGHTDNVGKPLVNLALSEKRAESVKLYLINAGVDPGRLTSHGYGDTKPVVPNTTPNGRMQNRRVEFVVSFEKVSFE